jgi:hypothetical protein
MTRTPNATRPPAATLRPTPAPSPRPRRPLPRSVVLALVPAVLLTARPLPAVAQAADVIGPVPAQEDVWTAPRWVGDVTFAASNALLAGMTAGVFQRLRGGQFGDGFARGAVAGVVAYTGRRIGAQQFDGAGLLGRQVSAVGVSMARNAGDGRPSLERLMFPIGPLHLHVDRGDGLVVRPKLHVVGLAQAMRLALRDETRFDGSASLSAGAPVFRAPGHVLRFEDEDAAGLALHGSIVLGEGGPGGPERVFAHERVHIIQGDYVFLAWNDPLEAWLIGRSGPTRAAYQYLDFGAVLHVAAIGLSRVVTVPWDQRPHELEASFLEGR